VVSKAFSAFDVPSIDTDAVYHGLISDKSDCTKSLVDFFGAEIEKPDGSIDRIALRNTVFRDKSGEKLKQLNKITHRHVLLETEKIIENYRKSGKKAVIIDAPLLFESGFNEKCDVVVAVVALRELRIQRIINRDGITKAEAEQRIDSQTSDEFLVSHSDYVINNSNGFTAVFDAVCEIMKKI
jgi:dephospho-CoA kinase